MRKDTLVILLILFLFGAWVMLSEFPLKQLAHVITPATPKVTKQQVEELVNKHLGLTGQKQDLHELSEISKNQIMAPKIGDKLIIPPPKAAATKFDLEADANENTAFNDLQRYKKDLQVYKPDNQIQSEIADQQIQKKYEAAYQEAYVKQFLENARMNGYEIRLNDRNEVVSVKPIRQPSNQPAFSPEGSAAK